MPELEYVGLEVAPTVVMAIRDQISGKDTYMKGPEEVKVDRTKG